MYVVGDVHGQLDVLRRVLAQAGLLDPRDAWIGGDASLLMLGDLVDRGPDGIGVLDLLMHLERHAAVQVVLGNHDLLFLGAARFRGTTANAALYPAWLANGGNPSDMARLTQAHLVWLENRPAMVRLGVDLFVHADAMAYAEYGASIEEVNARIASILGGSDPARYEHLLGRFQEHDAFLGAAGAERLTRFLKHFRAERVIHGHSPIARVRGLPPESVVEAFEYAHGRAVNVDPGLYRGGPGFVFRAFRETPSP